MTRSFSSSLTLVAGSDLGLSKEQKAFNRLTLKITKLREQLEQWQQVHDEGRQIVLSEMEPRRKMFWEVRAEMTRLLDCAYTQKKFTKTEKAKLKSLIASLVGPLLTEREEDDLKAIYARYTGQDYDEAKQADMDGLRNMVHATFGVDLGDDVDFSSPEKVAAQLHEKLEQQKAPARKKTAKQLAKEEQQRQSEQLATQSLRDVYRKLASSLHPDREQDPAERDRKTALMQRLNAAYENKNLLGLLELQLEIEQLDAKELAAMSSERLKHFNKVLSEQVAELQQQIQSLQMALQFNLNLDLDSGVLRKPTDVLLYLEEEMALLHAMIEDIEADLIEFEDVQRIKAYLKVA